ncbi:MAG TPA: hypothetical protein VN317_09735 [Candidatus Methanoperedens sp.]|nr:hypothetical protein [Candidatus Methanoperedens sp.]
MVLVPLRTIALASDLPPATLLDLLRQAVGAESEQPFSGRVADAGFVITRLRAFRSTFMPVLRGTVDPGPGGGSRVRVRLAPPGVVVAFMAIWLGFLAAVAAMLVAAAKADPGRSLLPLLAPAGLAGLSWHVMTSVFAADARWAVEHLLERLPALRPDLRHEGRN